MTQAGGGGRQPTAASTPSRASQSAAAASIDKPVQTVFVKHAALEDLVDTGASAMGYDIWDRVVAGVGRRVIGGAVGTITVPAQQLLDISALTFVIITDLGGPPGWAPLGDYYHVGVNFLVEVNSHNPWDAFTRYSPVIGLPMRAGWCTLNQDVMASWGNAPVHLVVGANQAVQFIYDQIVVPMPIVNGDLIGVRVRGRWLPEKLWRELNQLSVGR